MKLTKFEHAALVLEKEHETLVIDPGAFTMPLADLRNVVAIVVTHEHADHWTPEQLDRIIAMNPDAKLYGPQGVALAAAAYPFVVVKNGDEINVGAFNLKFYGETHAVIHSSFPSMENVGVMVDDVLFYPGDAFTVPPVPVDVLAAPAGAPWLKVGEAMDYITEVAPKRAFPTHEMVLSVIGKNLANERFTAVTSAAGGKYFVLEPGESIDL